MTRQQELQQKFQDLSHSKLAKLASHLATELEHEVYWGPTTALEASQDGYQSLAEALDPEHNYTGND